MSRLRLWAITLLVLAVAVPGFAQGTNGAIDGQSDGRAGPCPAGRVPSPPTNPETGLQRRARTSDATGRLSRSPASRSDATR